jgi:hypothetical protein
MIGEFMYNGVVEGFYGRPYTAHQRNIIISYLSQLENASFVYAPKNDPYHRLRWREDYPPEEWSSLSGTIKAAAEAGSKFVFGISPWQFRDGESGTLRKKVIRALDAGAEGIAVLFDDIPQKADAQLAGRQIALAVEALDGIGCDVLLCPSIYCIELLDKYDGNEYLAFWREVVPVNWQSFWTGNGVISENLGENGMDKAAELLGSKPVIWDNLLADDYTLRRVYLAGLEDRIPEGYSYFLNPSSCFPVALHAVYKLLLASGLSCSLPVELGEIHEAWDILGAFNCIPWQAGETAGSLLTQLKAAAASGASDELLGHLASISDLLGRFIDSLEELEGGFDLMPYAVDLKKFISWWADALALPSSTERITRLNYLMFKRLPFDHPLSMFTAEILMTNGRGKE